jgi:hypothetical protein
MFEVAIWFLKDKRLRNPTAQPKCRKKDDYDIDVFATGDDPLGRGARGAMPLHLLIETARPLSLAPGGSLKWKIEISSIPARVINPVSSADTC